MAPRKKIRPMKTKIMVGTKRKKGEGLTEDTGLTKSQGLAKVKQGSSLQPVNKRIVTSKIKIKSATTGSSATNKEEKKMAQVNVDNKKIFQSRDPESGRKKSKKKNTGLEYPKTKGPYKIKKGDTLSQLAKDNNTTVAKLMKLNPGIKDANKIRAGAGLKGINEKKDIYSRKYNPNPKGENNKNKTKTTKKINRPKKKSFKENLPPYETMGFFNRGGTIKTKKAGDGDMFVKRAYGGKVGK